MVFCKGKKNKSDGDSPSKKERSKKSRVDPMDKKIKPGKNFGDSMVPKPRESFGSKKGMK
jgi:hypothetical protein